MPRNWRERRTSHVSLHFLDSGQASPPSAAGPSLAGGTGGRTFWNCSYISTTLALAQLTNVAPDY